MTATRTILLATAGWAALANGAGAQPLSPAAPFKLERVVMLMRHGIRPPTKANPLPKGYTSEPWPSWPVDWGLLTPRGAAGVKLLGTADRAYLQSQGLFDAGCPAAGSVVLHASGKPRAVSTAESWRDGFMPGCSASVAHPGEDDPDPLFHGFDDQPAGFDGDRALREAEGLEPPGGMAAEMAQYRGDLAVLAEALHCAAPACPLTSQETKLIGRPHQRPELLGPADVASTASQSFLLEYLEGKPMGEVGWGRIARPQIEAMLRFHPLKFKYQNRALYIAARAAGPLALAMVEAMTAPAVRLALFAGHDTNIADMGGFLRLHWQVPSYPADDVPPGSALGFEVWGSKSGGQYVRAFYRSQSMDQLREQRSLTGGRNALSRLSPYSRLRRYDGADRLPVIQVRCAGAQPCRHLRRAKARRSASG